VLFTIATDRVELTGAGRQLWQVTALDWGSGETP
jgi:hypothetical protein